MNERIRELAEQSGYKPLTGFNFANSLEETYLKKFAELIVRECITVLDENDGALHHTELLKKHFGVER